jgi:hypothetical protein
MKSKIIFLLAISLIVSGCASLSATPTPTPTQTPLPTATYTLQPTETPTPTTDPMSLCEYDADFFAKLRAELPVDEAVIYRHFINGAHSLVVWYVEPFIEPEISTEEELYDNQDIAINNALVSAAQLKRADPCAGYFDSIELVVVDRYYNGWFSGAIRPEDIPDRPYDSVVADMFKATDIGYVRDEIPAPNDKAPANSCDWPTTLEKIQQHFSPELVNTAFYFVRDEVGNNVWANFYVLSADSAFMSSLPSLMNITMELDCLHPTPNNIIVTAVNPEDVVVLIGYLPNTGADTGTSQNGFDIANFQYQTYND